MLTIAKSSKIIKTIEEKLEPKSRASFDSYVVLSEIDFRNRYRLLNAEFQRLFRKLRSSTK